MFDYSDESMITRIQTLVREGQTPAIILHDLRAEGRGREIADYLYWALGCATRSVMNALIPCLCRYLPPLASNA